eukprot:3679243-Pyramimonas_sp.AAC.1
MQGWREQVLAHVSNRAQPAPLRCLLDANATLGTQVSEHVGDVAPEVENANGKCFHQFLRASGQCATSTRHHVGQVKTRRSQVRRP